MGDRPVIVVIRMHDPAVLADFGPHADTGHAFGYGMGWDGAIEDERTRRYRLDCEHLRAAERNL